MKPNVIPKPRGRPFTPEDARLSVPVMVRLNTEQAAEWAILGGPAWVRGELDRQRRARLRREKAAT